MNKNGDPHSLSHSADGSTPLRRTLTSKPMCRWVYPASSHSASRHSLNRCRVFRLPQALLPLFFFLSSTQWLPLFYFMGPDWALNGPRLGPLGPGWATTVRARSRRPNVISLFLEGNGRVGKVGAPENVGRPNSAPKCKVRQPGGGDLQNTSSWSLFCLFICFSTPVTMAAGAFVSGSRTTTRVAAGTFSFRSSSSLATATYRATVDTPDRSYAPDRGFMHIALYDP